MLVELLRAPVDRSNGGDTVQTTAEIAAGFVVSIMVTLATLVHMHTMVCVEAHRAEHGAHASLDRRVVADRRQLAHAVQRTGQSGS